MYRAPFFAVAALALAILAPSGPSHGADLSGSESEVQHKCVQRNAARQLSEDYRSRLLEIREIGSERRSDLINQRYTSVHEAAKLIMEKWNRFLAERKRQFYTDLAGIGKKIQEAAKAPDETRPIQYLEGRKQTVRVYLDDVHELKGGRTQEVRTTRDEIRACYRTQLDETKEAWDLARRTLAAQYWEVRQRIYSAPLESIGDSESEVGQLLAQGKPVSVDSIAPPENLIAAYDSKNGGAIGAVEALEGGGAWVERNGQSMPLTIGAPIYQNDTVVTDEAGSVSVVFVDDTSMAIGSDARLTMDEYVFDPNSEAGSSKFSVLRGIFLFTSGLIGRQDDKVEDEPACGLIGIRG